MDPVLHKEKVNGTPADELRIGVASWDEIAKGGSGEQLALKYAWPDKNGRVARGGEVPLSVLPQCVEFAIATAAVDVADLLEAAARGCRRRDTPASTTD
jgi:hypothetical protein